MEPKLKVGQQVTLKGGEIVTIVSVELRGGEYTYCFYDKDGWKWRFEEGDVESLIEQLELSAMNTRI